MTEEEPRFTIKFGFQDEETGTEYKAESTIKTFGGCFGRQIDLIGDQFVSFLRQVGFSMPNDKFLMESLTDEEYDVVMHALKTFRKKSKNTYNSETSILLCNNEEE